MFLNLFISSLVFSLRNNAWGFKKPNTSFNIQISLNRFSASLRNRSIASSMHLLISSTAERPLSPEQTARHLFLTSDTSLFNRNFLLFANLDSSFNTLLNQRIAIIDQKSNKSIHLVGTVFQ